MDPNFAALLESLHESFDALLRMAPCNPANLPSVLPARGIYLLSDGAVHLYVGRTNNIRRRVQNHHRPSASHNQATFAFRLAREATGKLTASYRPEFSRQALQNDPKFGKAFLAAKSRVANMELRFVEEVDPTRQALLEIYVATVLKTPHNDFENH